MDSQTKNVKYNGNEIFKEHHKDNKTRQKRPETMRNWGFKTDTYRNVALIRLRPSGRRAEENHSTKDMHEK